MSTHMHLLLTIVLLSVCGASFLYAQDSDQVIKSYITNEWQDSRYTNNGDGTITDTNTGLMWKRCSEGQKEDQSGGSCATGSAKEYTYGQALALEGTQFAGYSDWRVPNIQELTTLVAHDRYKPTINTTKFPNTQPSRYWSSSPYTNDGSGAWSIDFKYGYDNFSSTRDARNYVRLVRGRQH